MNKKLLFLYLLIITGINTLLGQNEIITNKNTITKVSNKGKVYFYWGWNISQYSKSDIRFYGNNYDFTIHNARAKDRVTKPIGVKKYLNPTNMTIPQTNARLGYFFHDNWNASIGLDHMKYIMVQFQSAKVSGEINLSPQDDGSTDFNGSYTNTDTVLIEDFIAFEHTDGLNYVNLEIARLDNWGGIIGLDPKKVQINSTEGFGIGILVPKTNATLLSKGRNDAFHLSGYGLSLKGGINITLFNHFFIQAEIKGGFINLPDIRTTQSSVDKAKQHFFFLQENITFGGIFKLF